jgi:hypothetical protein
MAFVYTTRVAVKALVTTTMVVVVLVVVLV